MCMARGERDVILIFNADASINFQPSRTDETVATLYVWFFADGLAHGIPCLKIIV